jgi:hypothetical protein
MAIREVRNELDLAASPAVVWRLMTDTAGLSSWNPHLVRVDGELRAGGVVTLHYDQPRRWMPSSFEVDVEVFAPEQQLRFAGPRSPARALLRASHYYLFAPGDAPDTTRFVHGERFEGALVAAIWPVLGPAVRAGHARVNDALVRAVSA